MRKPVFFACFAWAALRFAEPAHAQFTDAHAYDNTPVGTNQIEDSRFGVHRVQRAL